jgi:putative transposase
MPEQHGGFSLRSVCRPLEVARRGSYEWRHRPPRAQPAAAQPVPDQGRRYGVQGRGPDGTRRIKPRLAQEGLQGRRRRLGRVLPQAGLRCKIRRTCTAPRVAEQAPPIAPNPLTRAFPVPGPETAYVGESPSLPPGAGGLSVAVGRALCSPAVVGGAMAHPRRAAWVPQAVARALCPRQPAAGLRMQTDRGRQYGADSSRQRLPPPGLPPSMRRPGTCWDKAVAERFFPTLQTALISLEDDDTHEAAQPAVVASIAVFSHRQRCPAAHGDLAPLVYAHACKANEICCPEKC